jgi:hypothetical protein
LSYILVVDASGIDAATSPVQRRSIMQYVFLCISSFFITSHLIYIHIVLYFDVSLVISCIATQALDGLLMLVFVINYMPCNVAKEDWKRTFNHEQFLNCAMEEFTSQAFRRSETRTKWEPGMVLPLPPMIAALDYTLRPDGGFNDQEEPLVEEFEL